MYLDAGICLAQPSPASPLAHSPSQSAKKVVSFAEIPGIRDKLPQMAQQLDVCQRALSDFLEDKRSSFPRFYFLGEGGECGEFILPATCPSYLLPPPCLPFAYTSLLASLSSGQV